ncbi:uncharacterized protein RHOBADRAFT_45997 [Rhodotorula graminis WP1]|uniref:Protein CPL1-like domain-containing protein n=1 Tax=Rhodotorula graminis (strain WP1) TaxID=578459 RepID=A0A0P9IV30_RHOGW|nr:uncharacterized protein RHOBADRAFT_45997 [Rhodotorula graminis WP1]KPV73420.1 hypothetical protein RHOBADRAFT_45997 [Rhodotorula graminis WP1]
MRSSLAFASLATLAGLAAAQSSSGAPLGYGRFPCTKVNADGTFSADASLCADAKLVAPGLATGNAGGTQGDGVNPTGAQCVLQAETGAYFCGLAGAQCTSDANCDNGHCVEGTCQGGFAQSCSQKDTNCLGFLYCLKPDYKVTASDTCGGIGAFCNDARSASLDMQASEAQEIFDGFCQSGYCNFGTAQCDTKKGLGESCESDPTYGCATGLSCDASSLKCTRSLGGSEPSAPGASQRARSRSRRAVAQGHQAVVVARAHPGAGPAARSLCPAGRQACALAVGLGGAGAAGFECVDTTSALEQCGACAAQGGVDCTALPNVAAVGCVQGVCEVWACEDGFLFDPISTACVAE